ncbi:ATP-binding protein [[Mycoplasma] testudinis]|uniref:ATP-binding protein n=1 Tax=[Mycoplasma] testudinis TaxID=33924 RepID=UPI000A0399BB|nr:ATP-binding protein [[Mycoplasma] testudinis]
MIKRTIVSDVMDSIQHFPVTLITGARQVGKSTLCMFLNKNLKMNYVSLDDVQARQLAINDPKIFFNIYKPPLIIDEVQYAPILFNYIAPIVNKARMENNQPNGLFILTGSHQYNLMKNVTESLAGRVCIINLLPLSFNEIIGRKEIAFDINPETFIPRLKDKIEIDNLYEKIFKGSYPELYKDSNLNSNKFYQGYVSSYLDRDIREIVSVKDLSNFYNFFQMIASLTGKELNYSQLSKQVGVSVNTIKSWVSVLETSSIIHLLQPFYEASIIKRVTRRPKLYFNDTGLACYLARLIDPKTLAKSYFSGFFVETYMINEIMKSYQNTNTPAAFYYYRDSNQNEIDLVIQRNGVLEVMI